MPGVSQKGRRRKSAWATGCCLSPHMCVLLPVLLSVSAGCPALGIHNASEMSTARVVWTIRNGWECIWETDVTMWGSLKCSPVLAGLEKSNSDLKTYFNSDCFVCCCRLRLRK